jgi:dihydrofolate synthase / folylpolyglutamate synthase
MLHDVLLPNLFSRGGKSQNYTIDRPRRALTALGDPQQAYPTVILTGTNGKGSTATMLATMLNAAGYRTGLYTSPHLVHVNERIKVAGRDIDDARLEALLLSVAEALGVDLSIARPPEFSADTWTVDREPYSFFEIITAVAFEHFRREAVDIAVLEVGLGGRLDATNVTEPLLAVITSVGHDHLPILGPTLADVAREKFGVARPGRPFFSGVPAAGPETELGAAAATLARLAREQGVPLVRLYPDRPGADAPVTFTPDVASGTFSLAYRGRALAGLAPGLYGAHQLHNGALAVLAAWQLADTGFDRLTEAAIRAGLATARWPARFQKSSTLGEFFIDGAHNPESMAACVRAIEERWGPGVQLDVLFGLSGGRSAREILPMLVPHIAAGGRIVVTQAQAPHSNPAGDVVAEVRSILPDPSRAVLAPTLLDALALLGQTKDEAPKRPGLCVGSLYLAGELLALTEPEYQGRPPHWVRG